MQRIKLPAFPVAGGCQCGAVRYELMARPMGVYACHCKDCQRFSGAGYTLSMVVQKETLRLTKGAFRDYLKTAQSGRHAVMHSCGICGTLIWNEPQASPDLLILKPGTLDDSQWAAPAGHIWVDKKLDWVEIDPAQPAFAGQPPSRDPLYAAWNDMVEETH